MTSVSAARSLRTEALFLVACLLCTLPMWIAHHPPMVDIPQHAAMIASLRGLGEGAWSFAPEFEARLFTPYWLGYGLVLALAPILGVPGAIKLVVSVALAAFAWSAARFCRQCGVPDAWRWWLLGLPLGFAWQWGFLSFIVAMPLAFLFLSAVVRWRDAPSRRAAWAIVAWVHGLFFAHALIAAFGCAVACLLLWRARDGIRAWLVRLAPILSVLPVALGWFVWTLLDTAQAHEAVQWGLQDDRLWRLLQRMTGAPETFAAAVLSIAALATPWLAGARWNLDPARWLPFAFWLAFVVLCPVYLFGTAFTGARFAVFGLPLYFLCFRSAETPASKQRLIAVLAAACALATIGWHALRASIFDLDTAGYRHVVAHAQPGRRMLSLMVHNSGIDPALPLFQHVPAWYQAEAGGLVEPNFALSYAIPLRYLDPHASVPLGLAQNAVHFDGRLHPVGRYDFILVRHATDPHAWLQGAARCAIEPVAASRTWWLYRPSAGCRHR